MDNVRISVRGLVEFVMRSGSIDNRSAGIDPVQAMHDGTRIHKKIQKQGGDGYQPEVPLSLSVALDGLTLTVEGRADGIIVQESGEVWVDEIKSTSLPVDTLEADGSELHWAQAMCYAHFYAMENSLERMTVQLTYCHVDAEGALGDIARFTRVLTAAELAEFFNGLVSEYEKWARYTIEWRETRNESVSGMEFPFPDYRPGQYSIAGNVYRAARDGGIVFCQAPTGIGKTISTLFPSVKALGDGLAEKIFYLTAKTTTRQAAAEAIDLLRERGGLRMKSVLLTAKDKLCFMPETVCNPDHCPYADGHEDRINDAVWDGLSRFDYFSRELIEDIAHEHRVCPFEFSLDLTLWSDCIVGDYNHLFDPVVALKRFFSRAFGGKGQYIFLIDEAHNLVDRAREMYSSMLRKTMFFDLKNALPKSEKTLRRLLNAVNSEFVRLKKACGEDGYLECSEQDSALNRAVALFANGCGEWLEKNPASPLLNDVLTVYFEALFFTKVAEFYDERYVSAVEVRGRDVLAGQYCIDPSHLLQNCMNKGRASVLFSATLTPVDYYAEVLGGDTESRQVALPSPFERENLCLLLANGISTRYRRREQSFLPICDMIAETVAAKEGNYLVYFPSYRYMESVYELFSERYPEFETIVQRGGMNDEERAAFLERFSPDNCASLIGFCVLGGIYAEGIDLKGNRLIGTVIVGVGLPQIGHDTDRIRGHFDHAGREGYAFAYRYPGMNKVMQAVGRVIRGVGDRGVAVLIDDRFTSEEYLALFPEHWRHCKIVPNARVLRNELDKFWGAESCLRERRGYDHEEK